MAGQPFIYSGQGFSLLRDKNRFVLPNQFRGTVRESSAKDVLCLAKHDRWDCLTAFGLSRVGEFDQQIRDEQAQAIQSGNKDFDAEKRAFDLYSFYEVPFDGSGRFVMPEDLFSLAGIEDQLYFQGAGRFFTVWNPEKLYAMDPSWAVAQTACRNLAGKEMAKARKK